MASIIDAAQNCGPKASALLAAGVRTVIRYYSRDTLLTEKQIKPAEAIQLGAAGVRLGIVYEGRHGDQAGNFDRAAGIADAAYAAKYGLDTIGQPRGTTIYFAVDFDASASQISDLILPYFQGVADSLAAAGNPYQVGVYGSGRTCAAVLDAGLATRAWLCQSTGWGDHAAFLASNRWALAQGNATSVVGISCDPNQGSGDIGDFLPAPPAQTPSGSRTPLFVLARHGLNLRGAPSLTAPLVTPEPLPYGTRVLPVRTVDGWTLIDREGDGKADGFVSSAFLTAQLPAAGTATSAQPDAGSSDAVHVAELIRQGSSAAGLTNAREAAAASLPGYPKNGCAVHLSALLRAAGINVPMTWGAGMLANLLANRGWRRIDVGQQAPGDVGVCFDNTSPPGSDHVYLVIQALGPDEMEIADNQRTTDAPHQRFATGHGKTPTEYFLRA